MNNLLLHMENLTFAELKKAVEAHQRMKTLAKARYVRWKENNPERYKEVIQKQKVYKQKKRDEAKNTIADDIRM